MPSTIAKLATEQLEARAKALCADDEDTQAFILGLYDSGEVTFENLQPWLLKNRLEVSSEPGKVQGEFGR